MTSNLKRSPRSIHHFLDGFRTSIPILIGTAPFGFLVGLIAVENGLTVEQAILMSALVYGGASQLVGVDLFGVNVAPHLIILAIMAVNLRHVLYSASVGRYFSRWPLYQQILAFFMLADPQFAESERRIEKGLSLNFAWYLGLGLPAYLLWPIETGIGAYFGRMIPDPSVFGIDFLLPIYFFGLVLGFRRRSNWLPIVTASAVSSIIIYKLIGSPWHITIGALAGIFVGAILAPSTKLKASDDGSVSDE